MALPAALVPLGIGLGKLVVGSIATDLAFKAAFKGLDMYADHKETKYYKELSEKRVEAGTHRYIPKHLTAGDGMASTIATERVTAGNASAKDIAADDVAHQASAGINGLFNSLGGVGGIASSIFNAARLAIPVIGGGIALVKGLLGKRKKKKGQRKQQAMMREYATQTVMMNPAFTEAFPKAAKAAQGSALRESADVTALKKQIAREKAQRSPTRPTQLTRSSEFTNSDGTHKNKGNE